MLFSNFFDVFHSRKENMMQPNNESLMHDLLFKETVDSFIVKVVQIDKAREFEYTKNGMEQWLQFIAAKNSEERSYVAKGDELLMELNEWINKYVADEETQEKLNKWDIQIATNKGMEQEKINITKNLLNTELSLQEISKATGLTIEEIEKLKGEK